MEINLNSDELRTIGVTYSNNKSEHKRNIQFLSILKDLSNVLDFIDLREFVKEFLLGYSTESFTFIDLPLDLRNDPKKQKYLLEHKRIFDKNMKFLDQCKDELLNGNDHWNFNIDVNKLNRIIITVYKYAKIKTMSETYAELLVSRLMMTRWYKRDVSQLDVIQALVKASKNFPIPLILFGSFSRNTAGPSSDVDLLVFLKEEDKWRTKFLKYVIISLSLELGRPISLINGFKNKTFLMGEIEQEMLIFFPGNEISLKHKKLFFSDGVSSVDVTENKQPDKSLEDMKLF